MITTADGGLSDNRTIMYVNEAFEKMTGYAMKEVMGKSPVLLHGEKTDRLAYAQMAAATQDNESAQMQSIFYKKDGEEYWVSVAISPVCDATGTTVNYIAILRDIIERMNYINAIEEQNKRLEEIAWTQAHVVRAPLARIMSLINLMQADTSIINIEEILPMLHIQLKSWMRS